jgi:hypothetical protein
VKDLRLVTQTESETHVVRRWETGDGFAMTLFTPRVDLVLPIRETHETPRILPGSTFVNAAARAGLDDDYEEGMRVRYGDEM